MTRTLFSWVGDDWQASLRYTLIVLLLSFIFFIAGGGVSHKEKWKINDIQIRGAQAVSRDEIHATVQELLKGNYYFVYARDNSVLFPKDEIQQKLRDRFVRLENVNAERIDGHTIVVEVAERKPYALWCEDEQPENILKHDKCFFIDKTGLVLDIAPVFSSGVYVKFYGGLEAGDEGYPIGLRVDEEKFAFAHAFEANLKQDIGPVSFVKILKDNEYELLIMKSGEYPMLANVTIRFNNSGPAETLVDKLSSALEVQFPVGVASKKKLQYIDMRFGNKVFFGFDQ